MKMKKPTALLFEDDPLSMKLTETVLKRSDYTVLIAQNAEDGMRIARKSPPDFILMDIHMPGMDGLKLTRRIKSDIELKDIPIVAISGAVMQEDKEGALAAGCVGYIAKPIDVHSFVETIEKLIA